MGWLGTILALLGSLVGLWALLRYVVLIDIRIDKNTFRTVYELAKEEKKLLLQEEFFTEGRHPVLFVAICMFPNAPYFFIRHSERLLQAGWQGKDFTSDIICLRWQYRKLKLFLTKRVKEMQLDKFGVPVEVATPYYIDKIGSLKTGLPPLIDEEIWKDIEAEVAEVVAGKRLKTGAILYGPPGNGKSSFIQYLATKYKMPVKIITFAPEFTNHDIMFMFSQITPKSLVLLEDFDNYFDGRNCIIGGNTSGGNNMAIKFTFDSILNCMDGVYTTYENVAFIMTCNEIDKIDYALKDRPSRFKYVREFGHPSLKVRKKLLGNWADLVDGMNLDQIMRLKEAKESGLHFGDAIKKLGAHDCQKSLEEIAFKRFQQRIEAGQPGDPGEDWQYALNSLNGNGKI